VLDLVVRATAAEQLLAVVGDRQQSTVLLVERRDG